MLSQIFHKIFNRDQVCLHFVFPEDVDEECELRIGIDQIGIDITLLITLMAVAIGTLLGGIAIAFSLGSRTFVSNLIGARYLSKDYRVGERIRLGEIEGAILEISAVAVVVDTADGRMTVPAKLFGEQVSLLIQREAPDA